MNAQDFSTAISELSQVSQLSLSSIHFTSVDIPDTSSQQASQLHSNDVTTLDSSLALLEVSLPSFDNLIPGIVEGATSNLSNIYKDVHPTQLEATTDTLLGDGVAVNADLMASWHESDLIKSNGISNESLPKSENQEFGEENLSITDSTFDASVFESAEAQIAQSFSSGGIRYDLPFSGTVVQHSSGATLGLKRDIHNSMPTFHLWFNNTYYGEHLINQVYSFFNGGIQVGTRPKQVLRPDINGQMRYEARIVPYVQINDSSWRKVA
ncbi:MAG: hypothetical protein ACFE0J_12535 [Elainellaceae cyanobacterium]